MHSKSWRRTMAITKFIRIFIRGPNPSTVPVLLLLTFLLVGKISLTQAKGVFKECGGHLTAPQGIIQSPNFPGPFPVPISCRWVIHVPAKSKTVIYFTQYYLRHSFYITEYDHYASAKDYSNKIHVGQIDAEDQLTTVVAYRPFVVLDLVLTDDSNAHLRVDEYLMNVHGFNISYHLVPQDKQLETVPCSVQKCSYLGHCLASADFSEFSCVCFEGFHGTDCERGPYCDPDKGQNMCLNGGNCRYFYGSLVNACECLAGFDGPMCEEKIGGATQEECSRLQCSHRCEVSEGSRSLQCACNKGFKLDEDGTTCVEEEHYRVMVTFVVNSSQVELEKRLKSVEDNKDSFSQTATNILHLSDLTTARDFAFTRISETSVEIVFNLRKEELSGLKTALPNLVREDRLFGVAVDVTKIKSIFEPEMKLLSVENSEEGPAFEGKLLTLVCSARGSDNLRFQWLKDGRPFNMSLTHRNAWEIRLPETIGEKQISVLNMDGVTTYDRGEFTCVISDYGQLMNQSIVMDVLPYPQVEVTPITVSAVQGSTQTFRCWSLDEIQRKFTYSWLKNGKPLTDADNEIVEDLRPRGSRLLVKDAKASTNYTCCVTNKAGTSQRTGHMFVATANQSGLVCPNNALDGVKWNQTFAGFFNLQKCPTDAADLVVRRLGDGYTSRRCTWNPVTAQCAWGSPNYARCQSVYLIELYDMLMNIKLGYQVQPVMSVYHKLFRIACQARHRMFAGDLDITAKNLYMVVTMATDFPDLIDEEFDMKDLVKFLNILLEEAASVTEDEQRQLFVGGRLIQMAESLQVLASKGLLRLHGMEAATVGVELTKKQPVPAKQRKRVSSRATQGHDIFHTDPSDNSDSRAKRSSSDDSDDKQGNILVVRYDSSVHPLLDRGQRKRNPEEMFVSDVFSFIPVHEKRTHDRQMYRVDIPHHPVAELTTQNKTYCLSWEGWTRELPTGRWVSSSCSVIQVTQNVTSCLCPLPGHITAIVVPTNFTVVDTETGSSQTTLLVICALSLACLTLALMVYLIKARNLLQSKHMIHFNLTLSVAGVNLMCVLCLVCQDALMMCAAKKLILQFFIVSAFTFLMLDAVALFLDIHARAHTRMTFGLPKFLLIGWGLPMVSVICGILVIEASERSSQSCQIWCWWTMSHYHFYTVLVPLVCLMVGHTVFVAMSVIMMYNWKDDWGDTSRQNSIIDVARGECLLLLLAAFSLVSTTVTSEPTGMKLISVATLNILLTISTILFMVILKTAIRAPILSLCCMAKDQEEKNVFPNLEVPGIPSKPSSHAELEAQKIHDYCETVDRERYTNEHKRQLRTLISSSSSAGSFSAGAFSAPLGLTTCSTAPRFASSKTCDSAAESISFSRGNNRRQKLPLTTPGSRLRPEPSISRLLDSDYSKPVVERSKAIISTEIAEEEIHPSSTPAKCSSTVPIAQKSFINKVDEGKSKPLSTNSQSHISDENKAQRNRSLDQSKSTKDFFISDQTQSNTSDAQMASPLVMHNSKEHSSRPGYLASLSPDTNHSVVENKNTSKEKECESLLQYDTDTFRL